VRTACNSLQQVLQQLARNIDGGKAHNKWLCCAEEVHKEQNLRTNVLQQAEGKEIPGVVVVT
jgi:hypothetical protein